MPYVSIFWYNLCTHLSTINNVLVPTERKRRCERDSDLQHQSLPQQDLDVDQDCPKACTCSQLPNRVQRSTDDVITFTALRSGVVEIVEPSLKVICTNADLTSVPIEIPQNTRELYEIWEDAFYYRSNRCIKFVFLYRSDIWITIR